MHDNKLLESARSLITVIASGSVELSHEQLRSALLRFLPALIAELEIISSMLEQEMEDRKGGDE